MERHRGSHDFVEASFEPSVMASPVAPTSRARPLWFRRRLIQADKLVDRWCTTHENRRLLLHRMAENKIQDQRLNSTVHFFLRMCRSTNSCAVAWPRIAISTDYRESISYHKWQGHWGLWFQFSFSLLAAWLLDLETLQRSRTPRNCYQAEFLVSLAALWCRDPLGHIFLAISACSSPEVNLPCWGLCFCEPPLVRMVMLRSRITFICPILILVVPCCSNENFQRWTCGSHYQA